MHIYTSYFGNLNRLDVVPISISLYSPKWFNGKECKKLAPAPYFMKWHEPEYREEFAKQLSKLDPKKILEELKGLANGNDFAILCYEKPGDFCHRHLVAKWLNEELGLNIKEFELNLSIF